MYFLEKLKCKGNRFIAMLMVIIFITIKMEGNKLLLATIFLYFMNAKK